MTDTTTDKPIEGPAELAWTRLQVLHDSYDRESDLELYATWGHEEGEGDKKGRWLHLTLERDHALNSFMDNAVISLDPGMQRELRDSLIEMKLGGEDYALMCASDCGHQFDPMKETYRCADCIGAPEEYDPDAGYDNGYKDGQRDAKDN